MFSFVQKLQQKGRDMRTLKVLFEEAENQAQSGASTPALR